MMKKNETPFFANSVRIVILLLFSFVLTIGKAQVKIGENPSVIDPASILELEDTSRALVLTRVTDAQMQLITPLEGALVYNTDQECVFYFDNSSWKNLCSEGGGQGGGNASLVNNGDNTYTFTDANGVETLISFEGGTGGNPTMGEPGSIFFAGSDMSATENNNELFWDTVTNRLGIGVNANLNNKLNVDGDIGASQLLLNEANQDPTPLVIRGQGADQRLIAFQDVNLGNTLFNINFRGAGLNIDEVNKQHRLFIKILGGLGIETAQPTETLDVAGTLRVRELPPAEPSDNFVTVDANGVLHRSTTTSNSGKSTIDSFRNSSGRWSNGSLKVSLNFGETLAPLFANEKFKDNENSVYEVKGNSLTVKRSGLYDIRANLSLVGSNISYLGEPATISARILINGSPLGSISVAANNGSLNSSVLSSIHIDELLKLKAKDIITIAVQTDAVARTIYFNDKDSSSFVITKLK